MTDDERVEALLRAACPPVTDAGPSKDLWPEIVRGRRRTRAGWSWFDITVAAVVAIVLLLFPDWAWLLAYHL